MQEIFENQDAWNTLWLVLDMHGICYSTFFLAFNDSPIDSLAASIFFYLS